VPDRDDNNGSDLEPILVPHEIPPRRKVEAEKISAHDSEWDFRRKLANALMQIVPTVNAIADNQVIERSTLILVVKGLNAVIERLNSAQPRARESSYHDFDAQVAEFRDTLYKRSKDPHDRLDSERARAIASEAVRAAKEADTAAANATELAEIKKRAEDALRERRKLVMLILASVIAGMVLMGLGVVVGHFEGRNSVQVEVRP
jgi:hypothetical protein